MHTFFASLAIPLTTTDAILPVLTESAFWLVGAAAGLLVYVYLIDRAVFECRGRVQSEKFDHWDALLAFLLVGFFMFLVIHADGSGNADAPPSNRAPIDIVTDMVAVTFVFLLLVGGILTALNLRQISAREAFGFSRLGVPAIVGSAALLILLALPLINLSSVISKLLLAAGGNDDASNQELVDFFIHSDSGAAKWTVAISATIIAPMYEEFLFRGYIYGVARRYGGVIFGVLVNASLFALIHLHLPSFVPLFVLAVCLTMAYEWTGSLWVPMCMHAMFNSVTVINLLLGNDS